MLNRHRRLRNVFSLLGLFALVGCSTPTLDSNDLEGSQAKVRSSVESSQQDEFDLAMLTVLEASRGETLGTEPFSIDGMTADAVFAKAEAVDLQRDLVWAERSIESEREVVDARERLKALRIHDFDPDVVDGRIEASIDVENGFDFAIDSAWIVIEVRGDGKVVGGKDMVDFRPALQPGERRAVSFVVSSEAAPSLPAEPGVEVGLRFSTIERGGDVVLQEPSSEALAEATKRLAEAERRRDDLRSRLGN